VNGATRRLAAILSADAVGYSRLMAEDEAGTIRTLSGYRDLISSLVTNHRGRVVDAPGDNLLAEFPNALDAVQCAVEAQGVLRVRNQSLPEPRRMLFRMGVHLGDITTEGERVYGDGVNIAARLEGLADPGGLCISRSVHEVIHGKLALGFDDLGEQIVKNIPDPVRAYRVGIEAEAQPAAGTPGATVHYGARAAGVIVLLVGLAVAVAYLGLDEFVGLEETVPVEEAAEQFPAAEPAARETAAALVEAVDYFQQAIELDPGFALAYVGLADSYAEQVFLGVLAREEGLARAQAAADKALALHRKAAELDPLSASIIAEVGVDLESLGRFDEALARYQRALEVDPGYAPAYTYIGTHYGWTLGKLDDAVVWYAKSISLDPGDPRDSAWLGGLFLELGDFERAEPWIE
jgi:class 3 adenylate cyclase